jgi:hypothetical protein
MPDPDICKVKMDPGGEGKPVSGIHPPGFHSFYERLKSSIISISCLIPRKRGLHSTGAGKTETKE